MLLLVISLALLIVVTSWMNVRYLAVKGKHIELEVNLGLKGLHIHVKVR